MCKFQGHVIFLSEISAAGHFYDYIFSKKNLYLQVCKFENKYFRLEFFFFADTIALTTATGRSRSNVKVVLFFLSEIFSRGHRGA